MATIARPQKRPIVSGIIWLGLGIILLSITSDVIPPLHYSWPAIIIVIGIAMIIGALTKSRNVSRQTYVYTPTVVDPSRPENQMKRNEKDNPFPNNL